MITKLDHFLDSLTMYRLVLYYLIALVLVAIGLCATGRLPYDPVAVAFSASFLVAVCWVANVVFARVFEAPTNVESAYITGLILALILTPVGTPHAILLLGWAGVLAMASKYILAWRRQHIFNPAAIAVVITAVGLGQAASWWVGNSLLLPAVIIGGILVVRRIKRFRLVFSFLIVGVVGEMVINLLTHTSISNGAHQILLQSPLFFLAFVMLTEPATVPPTTKQQVGYGGLVGLLFLPQMHIGNVFSTPELALVAGNAIGYAVSPRIRLQLRLKQISKLTPSASDFAFIPDRPLRFKPGQYLEWTLPHANTDARGNRRYFTIASSPTEPHLHIGVRFYSEGSSFKQALAAMDNRSQLMASHLAGDFVLPRDAKQKMAFIAGGIGITPYRSMIKYLVDAKEKRDLTLLYSVTHPEDVAYRDVLDQARRDLGVKIVYAVADSKSVPSNWQGEVGVVDAAMIQRQVPDYRERLFYISGPPPMVEGIKKTLRGLGVHRRNIKTDFFPGYV
jgi:glycine betaine catabolism B